MLGAETTAPRLPGFIDRLLDPLYANVEERAVRSFYDNVGPYVVGSIAGLVMWNLFITASLARKIKRLR